MINICNNNKTFSCFILFQCFFCLNHFKSSQGPLESLWSPPLGHGPLIDKEGFRSNPPRAHIWLLKMLANLLMLSTINKVQHHWTHSSMPPQNHCVEWISVYTVSDHPLIIKFYIPASSMSHQGEGADLLQTQTFWNTWDRQCKNTQKRSHQRSRPLAPLTVHTQLILYGRSWGNLKEKASMLP